jgi:hypothetical protein
MLPLQLSKPLKIKVYTEKTITFSVDLNCVKSSFLLSDNNKNYKLPARKFSEKYFCLRKFKWEILDITQ